MSTPLTATNRIVFEYTVAGFLHRLVTYCKLGAPISGVEQVVNRDGATTQSWVVAAQGLWDGIRGLYPTTVLAANATLETRAGSVWNPVTAVTLTGAGTTGASTPAGQLTIVLNDTAFLKIHFLLMETNQGAIGHSSNGLGISAGIDNVVHDLTTNVAPEAPYNWQKSRGDRYIMAAGACRGATLDTNDKLRRARGTI